MAEKTSEIRKLLGAALSRRMEDLKARGRKSITEPNIARVLGYTGGRAVVAKWKAGESWPGSLIERALEEFLELPPSFFARIAQGMRYEEALRNPLAADDEPSTTDILMEKYKVVLSRKEDIEIARYHRPIEDMIDIAWTEAQRRPLVVIVKSDTKKLSQKVIDIEKKTKSDE